MLFLDPGPIRFQIHGQGERQLTSPLPTADNLTVEFATYAAVMVARILTLLDDVGLALIELRGLDHVGLGRARHQSPGIIVLHAWMKELENGRQI